MGRLFFITLFTVLAVASLLRPWIGVVCAYMVAVLTPQAVWFWDFDGLRPVFFVLVPTFIGVIVKLLSGAYDLRRLRSSRVLLLMALWVCLLISYLAGPYTEVGGPYRFTDPDWALGTLNKIFLLCVLACLVIDDVKKAWVLMWVVALSGAYLVYWANSQYLSGHVWGRLAGPVDIYGVGTYSDENDFAMLFVVVQPMFWYLGQSVQRKWLRWGLWLLIPFTWHAVFLTASRGGLVGIIVTVVIMAVRSKRRMLSLLLLPALFVAYQWQAGDLMKDRADTIGDYQTETSAETRIEAWHAAAGMIVKHPLTGVGLASFGVAFPDFSEKKPREAHDTFLQIAAESGVLAGTIYLLLGFGSVFALWRNGNRLKKAGTAPADELYLINEAALCGMGGFVVCALFLSLQMSEMFFCLCVLVNAVLLASRKADAPQSAAPVAHRPGLPRRLPPAPRQPRLLR